MRRPLNPTHVLMTADAVGGVWTYALALAEALAAAGIEVTLAVLGPRPGEVQRAAATRLADVKLVETGLPLDWLAPDRRAVAGAGALLAGLARDIGADLVHLNSPALAADVRFHAPVVGAAHSCLATWWAAVRGGAPPEDFRWRIELMGEGYRACDALIAPSGAFAAATRGAYGPLPLFVARNGLGVGAMGRERPRSRRVITAGRLWDAGKNLELLDGAAARLSRPVLAAGPLTGPAGETASAAHVELLGALAPAVLRQGLERSLIFASFASYEPFGLAVLEAAQAGCALVLSDIPTFRELWSGAAVFTPLGDADLAARALEALFASPEESAALSRAASRRAARYTRQAMAAATLAIYRWAMARPSEAAA
ncbi:MAG TPA: glycosyltransferase [Caulobacteraceae bacterium]|nr:glycosyltransferase [Caulobacteraceae bacterium]